MPPDIITPNGIAPAPSTTPQQMPRFRVDQLPDGPTYANYETIEPTQQPPAQTQPDNQPQSEQQPDPEQPQQPEEQQFDGEQQDVDPEAQAAEYTKLKAAADDPQLHEDFLKKLVTVTPNGIEQQVTVEELRDGYMMHEDYSRKTNEAARIRDEATRAVANANQIIQDLINPGSFLQTIDKLSDFHPEIYDAFEHAVQTRVAEDEKVWKACGENPAVFQLYKEKQASDRAAARLTRQMQRRDALEAQQRQQQQANQPSPEAATLLRQLDQLVPMAFKAIGQQDHDFARSLIGNHLKQFYKGGALQYEHVMKAAKAVQQQLRREYGEAVQKANGAPKPPPMPSRAPGNPNPQARPQNGQGKRVRIDEL